MTQGNTGAETAKGIFTLFLGHILFGALLFLLSIIAQSTGFYFLQGIAGYAAVGISLSQLLYAVPLIIYFRRRRRFNAAKGVVIGAVITVLLNGGCFVLLWWAIASTYR